MDSGRNRFPFGSGRRVCPRGLRHLVYCPKLPGSWRYLRCALFPPWRLHSIARAYGRPHAGVLRLPAAAPRNGRFCVSSGSCGHHPHFEPTCIPGGRTNDDFVLSRGPLGDGGVRPLHVFSAARRGLSPRPSRRVDRRSSLLRLLFGVFLHQPPGPSPQWALSQFGLWFLCSRRSPRVHRQSAIPATLEANGTLLPRRREAGSAASGEPGRQSSTWCRCSKRWQIPLNQPPSGRNVNAALSVCLDRLCLRRPAISSRDLSSLLGGKDLLTPGF